LPSPHFELTSIDPQNAQIYTNTISAMQSPLLRDKLPLEKRFPLFVGALPMDNSWIIPRIFSKYF